jgi:2'-5' RNA ligase
MSLLLITPDAERLVARWRAEHDWAAGFGIPAHITVRSPFRPQLHSLEPGLTALERFLPFDVELARLENRPGALVVLVEPDTELRELTEAVSSVWPDLSPHKADWPDFAYHLTVVRTKDERVREQTWREIAPQLPIRVAGTELWAVEAAAKRREIAVVARSASRRTRGARR